MAIKYDTNPLDPAFPEKAKTMSVAEGQQTQDLSYGGAETQTLPYVNPTEEQTRRFAGSDVSSYSAPYNGQYVPTQYAPAAFAATDQSRTRKLDKIGLPENWLVTLPYLPFSIGLIAGIIELLTVPQSETKVRFHAAQGLAAHLGILIITTILGIVGGVTNLADIGTFIFTAVTTVMLVVFAIKAWQGKPIHIESVDGMTNWLEEKIKVK
ncbi:MAG TPA: hypothetical protein PLD38_09460 [Pyrinomonadaceae bacterium]|nr:hypothetical protein [Chloracidobacterium sp.]MBP9935581.1 hypothetical protein [Pyrinomonadaceae bacterium]MBK7801134.1 hypothetical protein [Chloracidobacterium sp.]MBK9436457.1 hypothetical protein [Chloracidobacterium sp.]MBK9767326.1 hypothetical protein [Chloracidobacterium sp.]